jgi:hypothetical protein
MRRMGHIAYTREMEISCKILVSKSKFKRKHVRSRLKWDKNTQRDLTGRVYVIVN